MTELTVQRTDWKRAFELIFIIGGPVIAFAAITLVSHPRQVTGSYLYDPSTPDWFIAFSAILTHTHVMMVFYRSHLNENIFKLYPVRFLLVPVIFLILAGVWNSFIGIMTIVAFYWDEWHTILQTFGFSRIYDAREGNDAQLGRKLDIGISFVLGLFPHLIMLTFLPPNERSSGLMEVLMLDRPMAEAVGMYIESMRYPLIGFGIAYLAYYLYRYRLLMKNGYKVSLGKIALLSSTFFSAIMIALYYSIADAAHYFNIYHSLQYIFIVCVSEVPKLSGRFQLPKIPKGLMVFMCETIVLTLATAAGVARDIGYFGFLGSFWILSSLLHFWYDGFIWSVRRKEIT